VAKQLAREPDDDTATFYEADPYAWALVQADLLRAGRFGDLDLAHLIDEVADLARAQRSAVLNNARIVVEHLLKLAHSPAGEPRNSWRATVREHRQRLALDLTRTLRRELGEALPRIYRLARSAAEGALRDHGEDGAAVALPPTCPFDLDHVTGDWWPDDPRQSQPASAEQASG
jgi:hypothetical protein